MTAPPRLRIAASSGLLMPVSCELLIQARVNGPLRDLAERVEVPVERHVAARERARLVAAEDVDAAEVLDRREVLDDHLLARHARGPAGERDGADHRQELGREADRERDREEQRLENA